MKDKIINTALRCFIIVSKFLFLFWLAKNSTDTVLGKYGLLSSTIMFLVIFFGMEFHTYSNRELIKNRVESSTLSTVCKQFSLYHVIYLFIFPIVIMLSISGLVEQNVILVYFLIIFEHYSLELSRILIACGEQVKSSWVMFMRSSFWMIPIVAFYDNVAINEIVVFWLISSFVSFIIGSYWLNRLGCKFFRWDFDFCFYKNGLKTSSLFFISSILVVLLTVVDRYYIEHFFDTSTLSIYVLFIGVANSISSLFDAGVAVYLYPNLIKAKVRSDKNEWKRSILFATLFVVAFSGVLFFSIIILNGYFFFGWLPDLYINEVNGLYVLIVAILFKTISAILQYALYSLGEDEKILATNSIPIIVFISLVSFLTFVGDGFFDVDLFSVCFVILLCYFFQLILRLNAVRILDKKEGF